MRELIFNWASVKNKNFQGKSHYLERTTISFTFLNPRKLARFFTNVFLPEKNSNYQ